MANFGPKPWTNPFENISIISFFLHLVLRAYKGVFLLQNIIKHIFLNQTAFKKKREKWPGLDQNHGLTPLEKSQSFDFFNFLFYSLERRFFALEYHKTHFSDLDCIKKEGNVANFGPKPWTNPFGQISIFRFF